MPPATQPTDERLLGDREDPAGSFERFYRRHVGVLLRFAASRGANAEDAADAVAETFLVALRDRYRYVPRHATALPWLFSIARGKIVDGQRAAAGQRRREQALRTFDLRLTDHDRSTFEALPAEDDEIARLLAGLSEAQRAAVAGRVVEEREYAEIAAELGLSEPATRKHVSRGLQALRTRIRTTRGQTR